MPHAPNVEDDSLVQLSRLLDYERVRRLGLKFCNNIVRILQCYSGDEIVRNSDGGKKKKLWRNYAAMLEDNLETSGRRGAPEWGDSGSLKINHDHHQRHEMGIP